MHYSYSNVQFAGQQRRSEKTVTPCHLKVSIFQVMMIKMYVIFLRQILSCKLYVRWHEKNTYDMQKNLGKKTQKTSPFSKFSYTFSL